MRAVLIPVSEEPREVEIDGLADLQALVGGRIEPVGWIFDNCPVMYVNDEGKMNGMLPNRAVFVPEDRVGSRKWDGGTWAAGEVIDILFGPIVAVGFDPLTGEDRDISDEEIQRVKERFSGSVAADNSGAAEYLRMYQRIVNLEK